MIVKRRIFAIGRGHSERLIQYFVELTGKSRPRICLLPTAVGDDVYLINVWYELGVKFNFDARVQKMFISSFRQKEDFRDALLSMDAIYVSGGNTVNAIAIWRAHGVDTILKEAWEQGILLGGGSAGGICWFENGLTDSRPKELTAMDALGFLKGSFAPHYLSEPGRREYFHKYILSGELSNGYGCDDNAGLYFEGITFIKGVGLSTGQAGVTDEAKVFRVTQENAKIIEKEIAIEKI